MIKIASSLARNFRQFSTLNEASTPKPVETAEAAIEKSAGLAAFLRKTYFYTGGGVVTTLICANSLQYSMVQSYLPAAITAQNFGIAGAIVGLVGILGAAWTKPQSYESIKIGSQEYITAKDSTLRKALYWMGCAAFGVSMQPLLASVAAIDPSIFQTALISTSCTFGCVTLFSLKMPKSNLLKYGSIFGAGLMAIFLLQIGSLASVMLYGPNAFAVLAQQIDLYAGVVLFTGLIGYDTHKAIANY